MAAQGRIPEEPDPDRGKRRAPQGRPARSLQSREEEAPRRPGGFSGAAAAPVAAGGRSAASPARPLQSRRGSLLLLLLPPAKFAEGARRRGGKAARSPCQRSRPARPALPAPRCPAARRPCLPAPRCRHWGPAAPARGCRGHGTLAVRAPAGPSSAAASGAGQRRRLRAAPSPLELFRDLCRDRGPRSSTAGPSGRAAGVSLLTKVLQIPKYNRRRDFKLGAFLILVDKLVSFYIDLVYFSG